MWRASSRHYRQELNWLSALRESLGGKAQRRLAVEALAGRVAALGVQTVQVRQTAPQCDAGIHP
jgi:hypothetical protein